MQYGYPGIGVKPNGAVAINPADAVTTMPIEKPISLPKKPVKPKLFQSKPALVLTGNPARKLSSRNRCRLLKVFNQTRTGRKHFTVEIDYEKQTDADNRMHPEDFQAPSGIPMTRHVGLVCKSEISQEGKFYITLVDSMRQNRGKQGYTSIRLEGIKSLKIITENDGPVPPKESN